MRCGRPGRQLGRVLEAHRVVDVVEQLDEARDLVGDLILAAVDVRVVLGELAHAGEASERAGGLVAVEHVLRVIAQREVAVRLLGEAVVQVVRRAVHRLERAVVLACLAVEHEEHVLLVLAPVAGDLPQPLVEQQRRLDLDVAVGQGQLPHVARQHVVERRAFVGPEGGPGREGVEVEEIELSPQPAVIALGGLLALLHPGLERLLVEERDAVDALELGLGVIAAPVRPGGRQELDDADLAGRRPVGP